MSANRLASVLFAFALSASCAAHRSVGFDPPADFFDKRDVKGPYVEPMLLAEAKAKFTQEAIRNEVSGTVKLKVWLDERGVIKGIRVIQSVGSGLDEAAVDAVLRFRFRPAQDAEGNSIPFVFAYSYTFVFD